MKQHRPQRSPVRLPALLPLCALTLVAGCAAQRAQPAAGAVAPSPAPEQAAPAPIATGAAEPRPRPAATKPGAPRVADLAGGPSSGIALPVDGPRASDDDAAVAPAGTARLDGVERALAQNAVAFRRCYDRGLQENPRLRGKVRIRIVVLPDGRASVRDEQSDLPDPEVVACVVRRWREVPLGKPDGVGAASVVVAITFLPSSGSES